MKRIFIGFLKFLLSPLKDFFTAGKQGFDSAKTMYTIADIAKVSTPLLLNKNAFNFGVHTNESIQRWKEKYVESVNFAKTKEIDAQTSADRVWFTYLIGYIISIINLLLMLINFQIIFIFTAAIAFLFTNLILAYPVFVFRVKAIVPYGIFIRQLKKKPFDFFKFKTRPLVD